MKKNLKLLPFLLLLSLSCTTEKEIRLLGIDYNKDSGYAVYTRYVYKKSKLINWGYEPTGKKLFSANEKYWITDKVDTMNWGLIYHQTKYIIK